MLQSPIAVLSYLFVVFCPKSSFPQLFIHKTWNPILLCVVLPLCKCITVWQEQHENCVCCFCLLCSFVDDLFFLLLNMLTTDLQIFLECIADNETMRSQAFTILRCCGKDRSRASKFCVRRTDQEKICVRVLGKHLACEWVECLLQEEQTVRP